MYVFFFTPLHHTHTHTHTHTPSSLTATWTGLEVLPTTSASTAILTCVDPLLIPRENSRQNVGLRVLPYSTKFPSLFMPCPEIAMAPRLTCAPSICPIHPLRTPLRPPQRRAATLRAWEMGHTSCSCQSMDWRSMGISCSVGMQGNRSSKVAGCFASSLSRGEVHAVGGEGWWLVGAHL